MVPLSMSMIFLESMSGAVEEEEGGGAAHVTRPPYGGLPSVTRQSWNLYGTRTRHHYYTNILWPHKKFNYSSRLTVRYVLLLFSKKV